MRPVRVDETVYEKLASAGGEDLVSVFVRTEKKGREVDQGRIRLKNQLSAIESQLEELGWKPRQRAERLAGARDLLEDVEFWEHQDAGLAVFVHEGGEVDAVSLTHPADTSAAVMPVFRVLPLATETHEISVPVLVLTRDAVALFAASERAAEEMAVDLPSYDDVNWFVDREAQRQQHPDRAGSTRNRHGHEPSAQSDEDFARFLREVDSALGDFQTGSPLVVLGDDDVAARFANATDRTTLSPENSGVRAPFSAKEILDQVGSLVADIDRDRVKAASTAAHDQLGVGMATTDIVEAVVAAVTGRVERVLIDRSGAPIWGRLDDSSLEVELHDDQRPGDVDLLDRLVVWSRENGADIVGTESSSEDGPFIAVFRY